MADDIQKFIEQQKLRLANDRTTYNEVMDRYAAKLAYQ